jgi:hypothetical protein
MAKSRKKARKAAKRPAKKRVAKRLVTKRLVTKRKTAAKAKSRRPAKKKLHRVKARKETSLVDVMTGAASEAGELRSRLAGRNTFED